MKNLGKRKYAWKPFGLPKHNQILEHINSLPVGHKISVRQIAEKIGCKSERDSLPCN